MKAAVRKELDRIDLFLTKKDAASVDLWAVLTALRGPDVNPTYSNVKDRTTSIIRTKAFPRTSAGNNLPATFGPARKAVVLEGAATEVSKHFAAHIQKAVKAFKAK